MYYHSLSLIECMREPELDPETREKYKMRLEGYKEKLGIMAAHSYVNYGLHYKILVNIENNTKTTYITKLLFIVCTNIDIRQ